MSHRQNPPISVAIFSLVGVLLGTGMTVGAQVLFERARVSREREKDKQEVARREAVAHRDLRQGMRLVADELENIALTLRVIAAWKVTLGEVDDASPLRLPTPVWEKYREIFAREMPDELWDELTVIHWNIRSTRSRLAAAPHGAPLGLKTSERYQEWADSIDGVVETLVARPSLSPGAEAVEETTQRLLSANPEPMESTEASAPSGPPDGVANDTPSHPA